MPTEDPTSWTTIITGLLATVVAAVGGGGTMWWRQRGNRPPPAQMEAEDSVRDAIKANSELTASNAEAIHDTAAAMAAMATATEGLAEDAKAWQVEARASLKEINGRLIRIEALREK